MMRNAPTPLERRLLIAMLRERLSTDGFPRLQMLWRTGR